MTSKLKSTPAAVVLGTGLGLFGLFALLRIVAWDSQWVLAIFNAGTNFAYLPVDVIAVLALVGRRWLLVGAAAVVVTCQLTFVLPELTAGTPIPTWANTAPHFGLFDANVYNENGNFAGYVRQIRSLAPGLVTLEEATPGDIQLLDQGNLPQLPYQIADGRYDPFGFFVASRYRLVGEQIVSIHGLPLLLETTVELPSGPLRLFVVHTAAPRGPGTWRLWEAELDAIAYAARHSSASRKLVVGDFNATWGTRGFHEILDTGLIDAAAARGDALQMTWSQNFFLLPPVVRIDHILTGQNVTVTRYATNAGPGSDHREITATVAVRSPRRNTPTET